MNDEQVEYARLSWKPINDTAMFELSDGAIVTVKISITRAGVATTFKNPDGSSHYAVDCNVNLITVPVEKTFMIPKSQMQIPPQQKSPSKPGNHIT